ncbi:MAG: NAD+ synthase [Planctomycetes bacterium]|nr:NAD+ synthase [Planctomycetota bacterium]
MKIALLQMDPTVGDLAGNRQKIAAGVRAAQDRGADLVLTPELALPGYLPRDLLLHTDFIKRSWETLAALAEELASGPAVLVGMAEPNPSTEGRPLFNCAALIQGGKIGAKFRKTLLPTYDVFDEDRYFEPYAENPLLELGGRKIGVTICEDVWNDKSFWKQRRYKVDPVERIAKAGAQILVNLSASPFTAGKQAVREKMLSNLAKQHKLAVVYANQVGGNDDLIFDGRSCAFDAQGKSIARGKAFEDDLVLVDLDSGKGDLAPDVSCIEEEIWKALVLGLRDFVRKCGFQRVHLGLSGGIDSSLVAAIAVEALGPENVLGVMMPSPYSSQGSIDDSVDLAQNLGIKTLKLAITPSMQAYEETLKAAFAGKNKDVTEENLQARIRGTLLMALSNKYNSMLLTTGNKSEIAVGYCTLYGDMSGGLGVIADVPKTMVYRVSNWLNKSRGKQIIPELCITKAPSAELRPNQKDQDSLPEYDLLDQIVERHVEQHKSGQQIIAEGYDPEVVNKVMRLVKNAEFKRKQTAPGLKVTDRAFGSGWRMVIARKE